MDIANNFAILAHGMCFLRVFDTDYLNYRDYLMVYAVTENIAENTSEYLRAEESSLIIAHMLLQASAGLPPVGK